jgi:hypothetical protein
MPATHCSRCHRLLTDPYSIAVGMGPECRGGAAKRGVKFPKPRWKVMGGRIVFAGLEGSKPPLPATSTDEENDDEDEGMETEES